MKPASILILGTCLLYLAACSSTTQPTMKPVLIPTDTPYREPTATSAPTGFFKVVILDDTSSAIVSEEETDIFLGEANSILYQLTGFAFEKVQFIQAEPRDGETREDIPTRYLREHPEIQANGIILFSYGSDDYSRKMGGYAIRTKSLQGVVNTFGGKDYLPIAVVDPTHRYAVCGYGGQDQPSSSVSVDGECRNQQGTTCVQKYGYSMCANAIDNLYASTPTYMVSSSIVHEFMHEFGYMDNVKDHYNDTCATRMGWEALDWWDPAVLRNAELSIGICPDVLEKFKESYRP